MSIETPEHWNGETKRMAAIVAQGQHAASEKMQAAGLLAIATELAELRRVLEPEVITVVEKHPDEMVQHILASAAEWMRDPQQLPEGTVLKQVGWYCAGGHPIDTEGGTKLTAEPNVRLDDPCEWAVPMYVLVKE